MTAEMVARADDLAPIPLEDGRNCLHDPAYKVGPYVCTRELGHRGPHRYSPLCFCEIVGAAST